MHLPLPTVPTSTDQLTLAETERRAASLIEQVSCNLDATRNIKVDAAWDLSHRKTLGIEGFLAASVR